MDPHADLTAVVLRLSAQAERLDDILDDLEDHFEDEFEDDEEDTEDGACQCMVCRLRPVGGP